MTDFKVGTMGSYLKEHDGKRPAVAQSASAGGFVVESMGEFLKRKAAAVAEPKKRAARAKADVEG